MAASWHQPCSSPNPENHCTKSLKTSCREDWPRRLVWIEDSDYSDEIDDSSTSELSVEVEFNGNVFTWGVRMGLREYASKRHLAPLWGASCAILIGLRPAYWPFATFGNPDHAVLLQFANQLIWMGVALTSIYAADSVAIMIVRYRGLSKEFSVIWPTLAGILVAKTIVDFTFAGRPLPAGSQWFFVCERWIDTVAIASLPILYLVAKRIGRPSDWPIVKAIRLEPGREIEPRSAAHGSTVSKHS